MKTNANTLASERRSAERKVVHIGANAILANSEATLECTILDVSETGAKLELNNVDIIPAHLKLYIPEIDQFFECDVVWRVENQMGVQFNTPVCIEALPQPT